MNGTLENDPYRLASRPPLCRIGFFIELPFDARLPPEHALNVAEINAPTIEGWDDFNLQRYLGFPPVDAAGAHPTTTLYFQRRLRFGEPPLRAELAAFGRQFYELLGTSRSRRLWTAMKARVPSKRHHIRESRTVVLAQRVNVAPQFPPPNSWVDGEFEKALSVLNRYLFALGWTSNDSSLGPVVVTELAPILFGFMVDIRQAARPPGRRRHRVEPMTFMFLTPGADPREPDPLDEGVIAEAQAVVQLLDYEPPFMPSGEMLYASQRSLRRGRFTQAVLEAGTSIELLVNTSIRMVAPLRGDSDDKVQNVLSAPFANRVRDHFTRILEFQRDLDVADDELGEWWKVGYALRNRVVHDGYLPNAEEALSAVVTANVLSDAVGERLHRDPATHPYMDGLSRLHGDLDD